MGPVLDISYSLCKFTSDRKFLIPDETHSLPVKQSIVENNAEFIDSLDTYKSATSHSINAGLNAKFAVYGKLGGKFSAEYQQLKSRQFRENAATIQIQLRHKFYTIKQYPDSTLHPRFKARLLEIASYLKSNDSESANYSSQMLVRDFGTHFLTSIDAGAVLVRQDNYQSSVLKNDNSRVRSLTVGAEFEVTYKQLVGGGANFGYQGRSAKFNVTTNTHNRTSSKVYTYGGPPYRLEMNLSEWERNLADDLVAIDRTGKPLSTAITTQSMLPEIDNPIEVYELKSHVLEAIKQYYIVNTHIGCTNPSAAEFDYHANTEEDGSCSSTGSLNFTFGGIFQRCTSNRSDYETEVCGDLVQKNYITGNFSCPGGFDAIFLLKGRMNRVFKRRTCEKKCKYVFFKCQQLCEDFGEASYTTFWCAPQVNDTKHNLGGYLFGGIYSESSSIRNLVTRSFSCPKSFLTLKLGQSAYVCVSEDKAVAQNRSVPFGGFFSCLMGNRLLGNARVGAPQEEWDKGCPNGFTEHVATIDNECSVKYCMKAGMLLKDTELDLIQPPFIPKPPIQRGLSYTLGQNMASYNSQASVAVVSPVVFLLMLLFPNVFMHFL